MKSFFGIKNFKSHKVVVEFFLSFRSFKSREKWLRLFLVVMLPSAFIWCTNFLEQHFLGQFPLNFFDYNNILISMKKDAEQISVNTVKATFLLQK